MARHGVHRSLSSDVFMITVIPPVKNGNPLVDHGWLSVAHPLRALPSRIVRGVVHFVVILRFVVLRGGQGSLLKGSSKDSSACSPCTSATGSSCPPGTWIGPVGLSFFPARNRPCSTYVCVLTPPRVIRCRAVFGYLSFQNHVVGRRRSFS